MKKDEKSAVSAVLFDVDGTLADTERDGHRPAFNAAFRELGLDWEWGVELYGELLAITGGKERIRHFIDKHAPAELARSGLDDWIARLHKVKTRHYVEALERGGIPLRPGVARLIRQLSEYKNSDCDHDDAGKCHRAVEVHLGGRLSRLVRCYRRG
jgi:beta-phosphoglucomutase-like phosphatase (HAD superfamily)